MNELVRELESYAEYLKVDGQTGRAKAYSRAANSLRERDIVPPNPADIHGVGSSVRETIIEFQVMGEIPECEELRDKHSYYDDLGDIDGVGPKTAAKLGDAGIANKDELRDAIESRDVLDVDGIGEKTAQKLRAELKNNG